MRIPPKRPPRRYLDALKALHGVDDHKGLRRQLDIAYATSDKETVKQLTPVVLGTKHSFWAPVDER